MSGEEENGGGRSAADFTTSLCQWSTIMD